MDGRAILHVDMDAFYASVEQRDDPALRGRPVIVGGTGGRGVVAAASYEVAALRGALGDACPRGAAPLPGCSLRAAAHRPLRGRLGADLRVFHEFTPLVQGLSLDEAFLDVTASIGALGDCEHIAREIKRLVRERTELTASVGVAPNKLVAKIASELRKPDGLVVVRPDEVRALLDPLPIRRLFGLGAKTAPKVEALGIRTLGELRAGQRRPAAGRSSAATPSECSSAPPASTIARWCRTATRSRSAPRRPSKPTSPTTRSCAPRSRGSPTRPVRACAPGSCLRGCVTVKIRRGDFTTYTRQRRFEPPTQETKVITALATDLLDAWLSAQPRAALRLLGVGVSDLAESRQADLFPARESVRNRQLDAAVDGIRARFGRAALGRASALDTPGPGPARPRTAKS